MGKKVLKILSYNIHKGFSLGNQSFILNQIKLAIQTFNADIVFLQEVIGEHQEYSQKYKQHWPSTSQFEFLADTVWPHYAYGKNAIYNHGHHGNAILSRYPIVFSENIDISSSVFERRGLLHGIIEIPRTKAQVNLFCVHFSLLEKDRDIQLKKLTKEIKKLSIKDPLIIAGDFNDWRKKISTPLSKLHMQEVFEDIYGYHPRTFPSWLPLLSLDRIYYRGLAPVSAHCLTGPPWNKLSDHIALYAEIELEY